MGQSFVPLESSIRVGQKLGTNFYGSDGDMDKVWQQYYRPYIRATGRREGTPKVASSFSFSVYNIVQVVSWDWLSTSLASGQKEVETFFHLLGW